jgi:MinD superfamily P-loop ATPase
MMQKPYGVVLNKCSLEKNPAEAYCQAENIDIIGKIPFDPVLGKLGSEGKIAVRQLTYYKMLFSDLLKRVKWGGTA